MTPVFRRTGFIFEEGETIPDHIDEFPCASERDLSKIWLEGEDTFEGEYYPLAIDVDDLPTASMLLEARLRYLEETQPSESSGGQDGIQDRVYIRHPK